MLKICTASPKSTSTARSGACSAPAGRPRPGASTKKSSTAGSSPGGATSMYPPAPSPVSMGSATNDVNMAASAASTALPPARRTSAPASAVRGWPAATTPRIGRGLRLDPSIIVDGSSSWAASGAIGRGPSGWFPSELGRSFPAMIHGGEAPRESVDPGSVPRYELGHVDVDPRVVPRPAHPAHARLPRGLAQARRALVAARLALLAVAGRDDRHPDLLLELVVDHRAE